MATAIETNTKKAGEETPLTITGIQTATSKEGSALRLDRRAMYKKLTIAAMAFVFLIALVWFGYSISHSIKSNAPATPTSAASAHTIQEEKRLVIAPVGRWSDEIRLEYGRCVRWAAKTSTDQFSVEYMGHSGGWQPYVGAGRPEITFLRFTSKNTRPADVEVMTRKAGHC